MFSSDTLVGAKVVKGAISRGGLEVEMVAKASSIICGGCEVTSFSGSSIPSTWGPRCVITAKYEFFL